MSKSNLEKEMLSEQQHLDEVVSDINSIISELEQNKPYPEISRYSTSDVADRGDLRYKKSRNFEVERLIKDYFGFIDSPYFARMDLFNTNDDKEERIYIGEKLLKIGDRILVFDWRSPVPNQIYNQSVFEFSHDKNNYNVLLRRKFDIKESKLKSYNDLYNYVEEIFSEGVTDPFLINVLREKHGQHRLTNIVKTIQENQNRIIQSSMGQSFIVQGCAGSGKTMILLHRVSYLKYNNPSLDLNKIKIITPSENFNIHINDLSDKLELDRIDHMSITEYYKYLLSKYDEKVWSKIKNVSDIVPPDEFILEVYSLDFYNKCMKSYKNFINNFYRSLNINQINNIVKKRGLKPYIESIQADNFKIEGLKRFIINVLLSNDNRVTELAKNKGILENLLSPSNRLNVIIKNKRIKERRDSIKKLDKVILNDEESSVLKKSLKIIESFDYRKLYRDTFTVEINNLNIKYNMDSEKLYKHNLFLYLHFYVLFEGKVVNSDQFLNIDEGQDLSPSEYRLFQLVNGEKTIFNIYGDINQSTSPKGIKDWKEIKILDKGFILNENYRNTIEITEFCNKEFGYNIAPIGISGESVKVINIDQGIDLINMELSTKANDERTAVIAKNDKTNNYKKLISLGLERNDLESSKISIFTVEESKGLEFDKVFVLKEGMTKNEKYIAYTRALNNLIVIEDQK